MNLSCPRSTVLRTAAATALVTATLGAALPSAAHAAPSDRHRAPGDISVNVTIENNSAVALTLAKKGYKVKEGSDTTGAAISVPSFSSDLVTTVSNEDEGGTAGSLKYKIPKGSVEIRWSNPYEGEGSYTCYAFPEDDFNCRVDADDDAHADVTFTVTGG
ncbi:hypothetical protein ACFQFC_25015 [Amorphoplanes digitatis]|uniref:Uncharacterized protein n=1 Tax=Actinoplanes digitatis TaxID=1868 RepID=A0A7W7I6S8_9ACTN|nr:hypothetical protein [Actinoplanes digitatis]MBB4767484.1 hypothetical protein [Actinoplanes digitatis]GID97444.1 hypothetical protein Adi01nite_68560 [Actinoplanes digitatis]